MGRKAGSWVWQQGRQEKVSHCHEDSPTTPEQGDQGSDSDNDLVQSRVQIVRQASREEMWGQGKRCNLCVWVNGVHGYAWLLCRVARTVTKDERLILKVAPKWAEPSEISCPCPTAALLNLALSPGSQTPREEKWGNTLKALAIASFSAPKILHSKHADWSFPTQIHWKYWT